MGGRHIPRRDLTRKKNPEFVQSFPEFSLSFPEFSPKKMDLRISLVLIGVLAFVHSGEAIKCHQCTSYTEAGCGDPFKGDFSKDCPADGKEYFCRKIFQNVRSDVKSFVAVDMKNIRIWLVKKKTNIQPFWRNTILLSLPASMISAMAHPHSRFQ